MNPQEKIQLPHDINGLLAYGFPWGFVLAIVAATIAVMLLFFYLWRYLKKRQKEGPKEVPRDLLKEALASLASLKKQQPWRQKTAGEFCFAASLAYREVLEATLEIRATDMTVGEIKRALKNHSLPQPLSEASIVASLQQADMVKFAGQEMSEDAAETWRTELLKGAKALASWLEEKQKVEAELRKKAPAITVATGGDK